MSRSRDLVNPRNFSETTCLSHVIVGISQQDVANDLNVTNCGGKYRL